MTGAGFILAINMALAGLLAAAFAGLAVFDMRRIAARWFALGYVIGAFYLLLEFALPFAGGALWLGVLGYASFLAALVAFAVGLSRLYERDVPWRLLAALFVTGVAARLAIEGLPRDSLFRQLAFQFPYAALQAVGLWLVMGARRRLLDNLLAAVLALSALQYLAKPFIALVSGGVGASAAAYSATFYAMVSQSSGIVLALALALLLFVILVRDIFEALAARSEIDSLSGLLNRRGFEERRDLAIRQRRENGMPLSLVLCDLDHFKEVNDTYGHAAGDAVIVAFARFVTATTAGHHVTGRIGGEEFAVLLPGANLAAARLLAEEIRAAFATAMLPQFPPDQKFSASFGVAEARHGEGAGEWQARADAALYLAKREGRNCVRAALPSAVVTGFHGRSGASPQARSN